MAALDVYVQIGMQLDSNTLATDVIPALWGLALGPLLNLEQVCDSLFHFVKMFLTKQFQYFMKTIKMLSNKIEQEHTRKLQDSSTNSASSPTPVRSFATNNISNGSSHDGDDNFEDLVYGKKSAKAPIDDDFPDAWVTPASRNQPSTTTSKPTNTPSFAWSSPAPTTVNTPQTNTSINSFATLKPQPSQNQSRTVTPDSFSNFAPLQPAKPTEFSRPLQPTQTNTYSQPLRPNLTSSTSVGALPKASGSTIDWSAASKKTTFPPKDTHPTILYGQTRQQAAPLDTEFSGWVLPPPPSGSKATPSNNFIVNNNNSSLSGMSSFQQPLQPQTRPLPNKNPTKSGLDAFESLL